MFLKPGSKLFKFDVQHSNYANSSAVSLQNIHLNSAELIKHKLDLFIHKFELNSVLFANNEHSKKKQHTKCIKYPQKVSILQDFKVNFKVAFW